MEKEQSPAKGNNMGGPQTRNVEQKSNIKKEWFHVHQAQKQAELPCAVESSGWWLPLGVKGLEGDRRCLLGAGDVVS